MRTNIDIDDKLLAEVMRITGAKTKREAVHIAMRELLALYGQTRIRELWGIGWEGDLDAMRRNA
jgi:Arc/MetJ family transcription regulator